jgi:hypothetical protein
VPGCLGRAAPVGQIVVLSDPEEQDPAGGGRELRLLVDRAPPDLLSAVRQVPGVRALSVRDVRGCALLRMRAARRTTAYAQIEDLCRAQGVWILDVLTAASGPPSFAAPARLVPLPRSQALLELLRRYQGGFRSAVMDELGGHSTRLLAELAAIVGQARCYRLYVGSLEEMVELVCGLG